MLSKILGILDYENKKKIFLVFILYFPLNFIETFSIATIPGLIILISEPEKISNFLPSENILNFLIQKELKERIFIGTIFIIFIFLLRSLCIIVINWFEITVRYKITIQNSKKLYSSYLNKPYIFHVNNSSSSLIQNMNDSVRSISVIFAFLEILKNLILLSFITIVVFVTIPTNFLGLFIFILVPMIFLFFILKNLIKKLGVIAREYRILSHKSISQGFLNIKFIKILSNEYQILEDFVSKNKVSLKQDAKLTLFNVLPRIVLEFFTLLFIIIFIYLNIEDNSSFTKIIPVLTLIVVSAVRMIPSFSQISINTNIIKFNFHTIEKINNEIFEWERKKSSLDQKKINLINSFKKEIKLSQIYFSYDKKKNIIDNLSLSIKNGEKIALFGKSGSGKTTLTDMILGLLTPNSGVITCDGIEISKDLSGWRKLLTYVPQNVVLFDESIKRNICFNLDDTQVNHENYQKALRVSGLDKIIKEFPDQDNTNVGYLAGKVSGGQKQRIGIARAVYLNRPIYILDEATNSLDKKSENEILKNLFENNITIIMISHDLEISKKCDKIINLNNTT